MATLEDATPSDEGSEDERSDGDVPIEEAEAAPIGDEPKEETIIEVAHEWPPPECEEVPVVPAIESNNFFGWGVSGASKSKKKKKLPRDPPVGWED